MGSEMCIRDSYGKHLGLRGPVARLLDEGDAKALELRDVVETLKTEAVRDGLLSAHGVYQWYRARASGETLTLLGAGGEPPARFTFPRQPDGERLCLADYVTSDDAHDYVALFAVTCGGGVRERAAAWKERGEYLRSHALQALAIETAEAFAAVSYTHLTLPTNREV